MAKYVLSLEPARAPIPALTFSDRLKAESYALLMAKRLALSRTPTTDERVLVLDEQGEVVHEQSVSEADPLAWLR